ncbi:sensor histidine kinase [Streptomyces sp. B6B3]|uniref:sensor histidine kinase n=1 Tax=Streptomyces sp. B6B3 TaxID=3153570 RepID=UPI00325D1927
MRDESSPPSLKRVPPGVWVALAWVAGTVFTFLARVTLPGQDEPDVIAGELYYRWDGLLMLAVATALTFAGCRLLPRRPLRALGLLLAGSALASTMLSVAEIPLPQFLAVEVALYFVAANGPRRTGIVGVVMALAVLVGYLAYRLVAGWTVGTSAELAVALTTVIAWLLGHSTRQARDQAEQTRAQAAARAVTAERLRIARELHDMVAHSIGVIALQAGAAGRVIETQPAGAREALRSIEATGRETLSGLRRMLGALRRPEPGQAAEAAPLDPGLGLGHDVDRLAATTTAAGVRVDVRWRGERGPLPPEVDRAAYRIVQEAVTNVVRHAGTGSCRVSIDRRDAELTVEVVDRGNGGTGRGQANGPGPGFGLLGMRERVDLLGGEFAAAPRPGGGFRVAARLPVPAGTLPAEALPTARAAAAEPPATENPGARPSAEEPSAEGSSGEGPSAGKAPAEGSGAR